MIEHVYLLMYSGIYTSLAFKYFGLSVPGKSKSRKSLWTHQLYKVVIVFHQCEHINYIKQ